MRNENMAVDPLKNKGGSGVGGCLLDMLKAQGYETPSDTVDRISFFVIAIAITVTHHGL